jgi:hypothetical protein
LRTVVIQSYRTHDVAPWLQACMQSVRAWAAARGFDYHFIDDRLFDYVPGWFKDKAEHLCPITDLARLKLARELLDQGVERTIWVDADILVFAPEALQIDVHEQFAYTHEVWTWIDQAGQPAFSHRVNNSISVFVRGNAYLDFFIDACQANGRASPRIGKLDASTRFLSALRQILAYPLLFNVGMLSPDLMADIAKGQSRLLPTYAKQLQAPIGCANLCGSLAAGGAPLYQPVIDQCLATRGAVVNRWRSVRTAAQV